ncbi:hypothetical protein GCM10010994_46270 [Chelatococcus reniformis]|uniref:FUSC family protein n=1 Tax=Chelatococcus reniformis TaxID=1494448 RepID=A0A916URD2_9HYPH|nr:hypothetical protein GCM10010994_46270 [Chelatococcus reniformis]
MAAIAALALAYWLELSDPQWATLTVYLLAQPTVGAALGKGLWRTVGTLSGGLLGLVLVALFSQAAELLVAATAMAVGASFYIGAQLRNYASYGALLAGYTMVLVAYEGSTDPVHAWSIAADRTTEILIGIACVTLASTTILPRYAGEALREALARTFHGLARYVASALHLTTPPAVFAELRRRMVAEVVSFDALCSYALFETREMQADQYRLQRTVREFLVVLSVARGLFVRLDQFGETGGQAVLARLRPALEAIAARLEDLGSETAVWRDAPRLRRELAAARTTLNSAVAELEGMAGAAPFDPLANGLLILRRVRKLLHGLVMVVVIEEGSLRSGRALAARRRVQDDPQGRREALLLATRAALAILLLSAVWMATGWSQGFTVVSGGAIMLFFAVKQDNPLAAARTYVVWSCVGIAVAYATMVFVLPQLQGFGALAIVLLLLLLPAGLMAGTPSHAWAGIALGGFTIAEIGTGNLFVPDEAAFVSGAAALILGMLGCLAVIAAIPVTSLARRDRNWRHTIGTVLPAVARGTTAPRQAADAIVGSLADLLPRLALDRAGEDDFFRGTLGAASIAIELGRLDSIRSRAAMPADAAEALGQFLDRFAGALEKLAGSRADRQAHLAAAEALVTEACTDLSGRPLAPGEAARLLLHAGASLRFIADRFYIDRAYLERSFAED